ncbi:MAG TPA: SLC13 family permease [Syntrophales bacterium]|nr:SLC13 family permease [Syntrophales bacterium]HOP35533.1 SLC13 family permease [Syntrophales bacterium]
MPSLSILLVLAIVAGSTVLFVWGKLRVDVVALLVLVSLVLTGLIAPDRALYGFASPATATVAAMFVLSAGLTRTGVIQWISRHLNRLAGKGERRLIVVLCLAIAFLSAFVVNTAMVAIFIPVAMVLARARRISASRVMIPLSYASQFGGVCTLVGTSTNILVNAIAVSYGMAAFTFFEFTRLGLIMVGAGILYLSVVSPYLLPKRRGEAEQVDKYRLADYLAELCVSEKSPLIGKTWNREKEGVEGKVSLIKIVRGKEEITLHPRTPLQAGDVLLIHGNVDKLIEVKEKLGLGIQKDVIMSDRLLASDNVELIEVLVPPQSGIAGRSLKDVDFSRRYGSVVLALQRRGRILRDRLSQIVLEAGDTLLLQCEKSDVPRILRSRNMIVTNELTELYIRRDRAFTAVVILLAVVALAAFQVVPILVAAITGAFAMVISRCLTIEEAYEAIDWKIIFLLGGILPLGLAMEETGAAAWFASVALMPVGVYGPLAVLALIYVVTAVLTEMMSNNAAAVILAPIAFSMATAMGVDPRPFLVAIAFAASTSFATPIGYQTNTMVYAPGGYRFLDYTRIGVPLNVIFWILAVLFVPVFWPF